jgi:hypothetical protein
LRARTQNVILLKRDRVCRRRHAKTKETRRYGAERQIKPLCTGKEPYGAGKKIVAQKKSIYVLFLLISFLILMLAPVLRINIGSVEFSRDFIQVVLYVF